MFTKQTMEEAFKSTIRLDRSVILRSVDTDDTQELKTRLFEDAQKINTMYATVAGKTSTMTSCFGTDNTWIEHNLHVGGDLKQDDVYPTHILEVVMQDTLLLDRWRIAKKCVLDEFHF